MKSKLFNDIQENVELVKRHLQIKNSLINQLKDEISRTNNAVIKEHFNHHQAENEREALKNEISQLHGKIAASEQTFCSNEKQIKKLCNIIDLADKESEKLEEDY